MNIQTFLHDEDGAITIDWVVLTAAVAVVALGLIAGLWAQTENVAGVIGSTIDDAAVAAAG